MPKVSYNTKPGRPKNNKINVKELTCTMCGKTQKPTMHYQSFNPLHATGYLPYCKKCLKDMCVDGNGDISLEKVKQMLKIIDRPFLYDIFKVSAESGSDIIGTYMKNIAMPQYKNLGWSESVFEPRHENENKTYTSLSNFILTDDIIEFFGAGYSPEEYQAMYRKYNFLKNNYPEKTNMHVEALKSYVRYKVKEEFSIADDDVASAGKWADLANKAATAAKINPSQLSKADLSDGLSTFSELSQAVEKEVDIIPILPRFKYRPNDALDFNIWCYVNYIRDLSGLPLCKYEDVYAFYDKRKEDYIKQYGDPYGIFTDDTSKQNRDKIKKFITEDGCD